MKRMLTYRDDRVNSKSWSELMDLLYEDCGITVSDDYAYTPSKRIEGYDDRGQVYIITVTRYSDGEYEIRESNINKVG